MSKIRVFVSFDVDHDRELYNRLLQESKTASSTFLITGASERDSASHDSAERARQRIRDADQVIAICGEHSEASISMSAEIRASQEEKTPYFLLWGRRDIMCTKPVGAKPADGMFSWTSQFLHEQIMLCARRTGPEVAAEIQRNSTAKKQGSA